jgi:methylase of polypeptide subunit release factors
MTHIESPNAPLAGGAAAPLSARATPESLPLRLFGGAVHFLTYHFILKRRKTAETYAAGFRFVVPPTVFHPRTFVTGEYFAGFIDGLDLCGRRVADVGTGSGILALAAARAGAREVVAIDINPHAARAASENARINGLGDRVTGICSNLLSGLAAEPLFDVIVSNPPYFPGEPRDLADRAWHSGPEHRDIAELFVQARQRLASDGRMYVLFSARSDLGLLGALMERANFRAHLVSERSILIDTFVVYELQAA